MKMQELIDKCDSVVSKWQERAATLETVQDFADVFGLDVEWRLAKKKDPDMEAAERIVSYVTGKTPEPEDQYQLFNEMSAEDKYAMKSWRTNNGL